MTGNDGLGAMSAWSVFSSPGPYRRMSGSDFFALASPQFVPTAVTIGAYGGR
ncbi:glycoside hydrolase domain-containing protein [Streptomyces sp. P1-3]|uniref:glycoside hydrolase domain-containing protein n=1 Tax=Streptomyces sp. P1-3 TaxID=3421658 RepID=UPI003D35CC53